MSQKIVSQAASAASSSASSTASRNPNLLPPEVVKSLYRQLLKEVQVLDQNPVLKTLMPVPKKIQSLIGMNTALYAPGSLSYKDIVASIFRGHGQHTHNTNSNNDSSSTGTKAASSSTSSNGSGDLYGNPQAAFESLTALRSHRATVEKLLHQITSDHKPLTEALQYTVDHANREGSYSARAIHVPLLSGAAMHARNRAIIKQLEREIAAEEEEALLNQAEKNSQETNTATTTAVAATSSTTPTSGNTDEAVADNTDDKNSDFVVEPSSTQEGNKAAEANVPVPAVVNMSNSIIKNKHLTMHRKSQLQIHQLVSLPSIDTATKRVLLERLKQLSHDYEQEQPAEKADSTREETAASSRAADTVTIGTQAAAAAVTVEPTESTAATTTTAETTVEATTETAERPETISVGDRIAALWPSSRTETKWPGRISHDHGDGTYAVQYDDGDYGPKVKKEDIFVEQSTLPDAPKKPEGWELPPASSPLHRQIGDRVRSHRRYGIRGPFPGRITGIDVEKETFAIQFDDGDFEGAVPAWLLRNAVGPATTSSRTAAYVAAARNARRAQLQHDVIRRKGFDIKPGLGLIAHPLSSSHADRRVMLVTESTPHITTALVLDLLYSYPLSHGNPMFPEVLWGHDVYNGGYCHVDFTMPPTANVTILHRLQPPPLTPENCKAAQHAAMAKAAAAAQQPQHSFTNPSETDAGGFLRKLLRPSADDSSTSAVSPVGTPFAYTPEDHKHFCTQIIPERRLPDGTVIPPLYSSKVEALPYLATLAPGQPRRSVRVFWGCMKWSTTQLMSEVTAGHWLPVELSPDFFGAYPLQNPAHAPPTPPTPPKPASTTEPETQQPTTEQAATPTATAEEATKNNAASNDAEAEAQAAPASPPASTSPSSTSPSAKIRSLFKNNPLLPPPRQLQQPVTGRGRNRPPRLGGVTPYHGGGVGSGGQLQLAEELFPTVEQMHAAKHRRVQMRGADVVPPQTFPPDQPMCKREALWDQILYSLGGEYRALVGCINPFANPELHHSGGRSPLISGRSGIGGAAQHGRPSGHPAVVDHADDADEDEDPLDRILDVDFDDDDEDE